MNDIEHTQKKIMRFIIVSCIVLLGMMVTFLYDFSHRTFTHVRKQADIHLKELTEQEVTTVETKMNTCVEKAKDVAEVFGVLENPSDKEIETILSSMRKNSSFDQTFYVEKGGKSYSSDGVSMDADQLQNIKGVLSGKAGVSEIIESTSTGKKILLIYAPVTKGEEIVGVILGCFMIDNMADLVSFSGFDGEGYSFVIQQNGSVVLQTEHENKLIQGENFFRFLENTVNSVSEPPKNIEAQIKSKNAGYFTYQVGKETRYAYCCPTKFQDWCVISVVPGNVMKDYTSAIDRYAGMLALKLLVAFVVLLGFVIYLNLKVQKQIEKAHMDAESSRQKYALAMNHTDCQIFEYDITNHVVSNLSLELQKILHLSGTAEYSPEEMNIDRFFDPEQRKKIQDIIWEIRAGAEKIDTEVVNREGRWYKVSLSTIRPSKTIQVIGTIEDITYIHEMEQQYSQEEQYCTAMLREAAAGFSIDLITGTVLSSFQNGENYMELKKFTQYDSQMIQYLCACIHPEYQDKMVQLLMNKNLLEIHKRGVKEITEYFKTQLRGEEYIWVTSTVHFLNDPATAHPIIFSYM
ncbi:MAG: cache domain-containing protein, partial [Lachnospiraceae bacterium]